MDFLDALRLQESLVAAIASGKSEESLLLLEHPSVYTIGRGGSEANLLTAGTPLIRTNRGGEITWHGPGQLVGYPLLELGKRGKDLHLYLRFLEELLIRCAEEFSVAAWRMPGRTGVWASCGKLASIGVGVRRWVTMHGFAINASPDLSHFSAINPCGIHGCSVSSLEKESCRPTDIAKVKTKLTRLFLDTLPQYLPVI